MEKDGLLEKNPSFRLGVALIILWVLGFASLATGLGSREFAGIPLVTWTMMSIGVFSVIASIVIIPVQSRWEHISSRERHRGNGEGDQL